MKIADISRPDEIRKRRFHWAGRPTQTYADKKFGTRINTDAQIYERLLVRLIIAVS